MLTEDEVNKIMEAITSANHTDFDGDLCEEISEIAYCVDRFEFDDDCEISRHIDIEFTFGEYFEIHEGDALYEFVFSLESMRGGNLQTLENETRILLYSESSS